VTPKVSVRPSTPAEKVPAVEIDRGTSGRPEVALTLDAGADWRPTRQILETLAKEKVRCTFFLTGEWVRENPKTTARIAAEGHEIGNHSWDHAAFTGLTDAQIKEQLERTEALIRETTGKSSRPYFRPPLGARDARVRQAVADNGYLNVYWTLDSHDSVQKGITASQIKERVLGEIAPGSIVLLHCGSQATADALPEILAGLRERGLSPVPLSRLLAK
jgi:peptidoglycan/xylan/chitin deacetylase (PgdA/CDA1 family)